MLVMRTAIIRTIEMIIIITMIKIIITIILTTATIITQIIAIVIPNNDDNHLHTSGCSKGNANNNIINNLSISRYLSVYG